MFLINILVPQNSTFCLRKQVKTEKRVSPGRRGKIQNIPWDVSNIGYVERFKNIKIKPRKKLQNIKGPTRNVTNF